MRIRRENRIDGEIFVEEVRNKDFDNDSRIQFSDLFNGLSEMLRTTIFDVIPRNGSNNDMFQLHPTGGLSNARRLISFERLRFRGAYRAKLTSTCAMIARDHERSSALAPTFPVIRTLGAFANGVKFEFVQ